MNSTQTPQLINPPTDIGYLSRFSIPLIRRVYPSLPSPNRDGYDVWDAMVAAIMSLQYVQKEQKHEDEEVNWMKEGF